MSSTKQVSWVLIAVPVCLLIVCTSPLLRTLLVSLLAICLGSWAALQWIGRAHPVEARRNDSREAFRSCLFNLLSENKPNVDKTLENTFKNRLLISKNVDPVIEQLVDYVLRDYVFVWYLDLVGEDKFNLNLRLKNEMWIIASRFLARLRSIDQLTFFTKDMVEKFTKHFHKINLYHQTKMSYELSAHMKSEEAELNFLRKVSDILLCLLLPQCYLNIKPLKHLLREIITVQVLYNSIELMSDPDYLNQKILDYIMWQEVELERNRRTNYAYAETYDEFVEMIKKSNDIEELKRMRYYIVTEIMQSTAINNLKKDRGLDLTREGARPLPGQTVKGDHLLARNLPRYINQLRFAKRLCESRMKLLSSDVESPGGEKHLPNPHKMVFGFGVIMNNEKARQYFLKFLQQTVGNRQSTSEKTAMYLVLFWESVDEMKKSESVKQFEIANDLLYHSYFLNSIKNHIKFPQEVLRGMESFTMGNTGPDSFYQTQRVVYRILEERYYPLFIVCKDYDELCLHCDEIGLNQPTVETSAVANTSLDDKSTINSIVANDGQNTIIEEHISFAKQNSKKLQKALSGKNDALAALKKATEFSSKPITESDVKRIQKLEKEVKDIAEEIHQTESHVQRSQLWLRYLCHWKSELYSILPEASPLAMILVSLGSMQEDMHCDGWVITRTITEVIELKRKLIRLKPSLKKIEILRLRNISDDNEELVNKAKSSLKEFLQTILSDEACCKSEDLYLFFIPSVEHLRFPLSVIKNPQVGKSSLPFASFFGISGSVAQNYSKQISADDQQSEEELSKYLADLEVKENQQDDIAEPAFSLINEIFELQDNAGWLRKSLIAFVQISFGQTINKQIRETVSWLSSESMTYYYLCQFRDALWPDGQLAEPLHDRSQIEKDSTYVLAKDKLLRNIPDFLTNLVGHHNARKGMSKVFDVLQHDQLNKQLIYELLEAFMFALVPELLGPKVPPAH